jgi:cell shape-determining protein MreD
MRRALVLFLTLLVLWTLVAELNHTLAGLRVYLFVGALYVTYAALALPLRAGLAASLLGGLLCDANTPVWFGTHLLLFSAVHVVLFHLRNRLPRDDALARVIVALLANLVIFVVFSLTQLRASPAPPVAWTRLISDLVCSQVFLALVAPWFFALQARALVLARAEQRDNLA